MCCVTFYKSFEELLVLYKKGLGTPQRGAFTGGVDSQKIAMFEK